MKTLKDLKELVRISANKVTIEFRGNDYSVMTNNTLALDAIKDDDDWYYTEKEAYLSLYNEVVEHHNLK